MQVHPDVAARAALRRGRGEQHHAAYNSSLLHLPPPVYPPPIYEPPPPAGYEHGARVGQSPSYPGNPNYAGTPPAFGYMHPTTPQPQMVNNHNTQVNVIGFPASAPSTVVAQPAPIVISPPSYLGWSIFNFLCCFWPLGLAAIIYSVKVGSARNHEEAKSHSLTARNLNIAATTIAPMLAIIVVGAVVGAAGVAGSAGSNNLRNSYYSYGYYYYYTYLVYYTYYNTYSYVDYSSFYSYYYGSTVYYSFTATAYQSVTASNYATDFYYQYAQGVYLYG